MRTEGVEIVAKARFIPIEEVRENNLYPTFSEFLDHVINHTGVNQHFDVQYRCLGLRHVEYTYIGAMELLSDQFSEIMALKQMNVSLFGSYDKASDPRLTKSVVLAREWFKDVDQEKVDALYKLYEADFMVYNYSNFSHPEFPMPLYYG